MCRNVHCCGESVWKLLFKSFPPCLLVRRQLADLLGCPPLLAWVPKYKCKYLCNSIVSWLVYARRSGICRGTICHSSPPGGLCLRLIEDVALELGPSSPAVGTPSLGFHFPHISPPHPPPLHFSLWAPLSSPLLIICSQHPAFHQRRPASSPPASPPEGPTLGHWLGGEQ